MSDKGCILIHYLFNLEHSQDLKILSERDLRFYVSPSKPLFLKARQGILNIIICTRYILCRKKVMLDSKHVWSNLCRSLITCLECDANTLMTLTTAVLSHRKFTLQLKRTSFQMCTVTNMGKNSRKARSLQLASRIQCCDQHCMHH